MKPTKERPDSPYRGLHGAEGNRSYLEEVRILHSQPGRKTPKGAGLGWGPGGLDCSDYPERRGEEK
jgi:hypothetical protein